MPKSLYLCYFGLRQPLVHTQVLPYLREIVKGGTEVSLLTFEPDLKASWTAEQIAAEKKRLAEQGIDWHCLAYHKRLSVIATAYDIFCGAWFTRKFIAKHAPDVIHGRVHVPTLMGALARKFSRRKPKLLFDIRGFFPEEYTDAGIWPEGGMLYRAAKRVEKWLLKESDGFVVLTEKARDILFPESTASGFDKMNRPVEVIPCCVDLSHFGNGNIASRDAIRAKIGAADRKVIAYVGSFGGWYMTDEMMEFFAAARERDPKAFALVLTQREKERAAERLKAKGFTDADFFVDSVAPAEIPAYLNAADTALSFIKSCYSKQSSSPTKIAEYLACGLPVVSNPGVGDIDTLIERKGVGVLTADFSRSSYLKALEQIDAMGDLSQTTRAAAHDEFDLFKVGGERYRRIYQRLLK